MTTPLACNLPNQETMSVIEEKEDTGMVESSLMGSIDTRYLDNGLQKFINQIFLEKNVCFTFLHCNLMFVNAVKLYVKAEKSYKC